MVEDTELEKDFRERYAVELRKKKVRTSDNPHFGTDEMAEELRRVKQQEQITPGRRGEQIKHEEIGKEISRRVGLKQNIGKS